MSHPLDWKTHEVRDHACPIYTMCQVLAQSLHSTNTSCMKVQIPHFSEPFTRAVLTKGRENAYRCLFLFSHEDNCFIDMDPEEFSMETTVLLHALT